jgi:hypothetical protein
MQTKLVRLGTLLGPASPGHSGFWSTSSYQPLMNRSRCATAAGVVAAAILVGGCGDARQSDDGH